MNDPKNVPGAAGPLRAALVAALLVSLPAACAGPTSASAGTGGEWVEPDERLASQLRLKAKTVEVLRPQDRVEFDQLMTWFASQGEAAFPTVLELATSPDRNVANFGLTTLFAIRDPRLLEPLEARMPFDGVTDLATRLGYARAALAMGDLGYAPVMLEGMADADLAKRRLAYQALRGATRKDLPFDPSGEPEVRAKQIDDWRTWINGWLTDPMRAGDQSAR